MKATTPLERQGISNETEFAFETIFLRPGTVLTYVRDGQKIVETLAVETEVTLISAVQGTTSIVEWAGGEATAVEP